MNLSFIITILTILSNSFNNIKNISDDYKLPFAVTEKLIFLYNTKDFSTFFEGPERDSVLFL
jgi:hypothetical protein